MRHRNIHVPSQVRTVATQLPPTRDSSRSVHWLWSDPMNRSAKALVIGTLVIVSATIGTANARFVLSPSDDTSPWQQCHIKWVQVGPAYLQGYWKRVCE